MEKDRHLSLERHQLNRRTFLQGSTLGSAALVAAASSRCSTMETPPDSSDLQAASFELSEFSLTRLQQGLESGEFTARSLTELYLNRIADLDRKGPCLRAIIETNPEALSIADALDKERSQKGSRGPLHGIPIVLKDNIATHDKMTTTAGSLALEGSIPPKDSFLAQRLREAGAVLLAKANLSEWANFRSSSSSSGWSSRGGQCRNPYALDRNPCGSSSGSAVATSANLCAASIGTETNGSIVCPSNANGVVGLKPTVGLVSRSGIIPIAHSQDTAGPITRSVADAAILLSVLTGVDASDPATALSQGKVHSDYTKFLNPGGVKGRRLGVAREFFGFHEKVDAVLDEALQQLEKLGAVLEDIPAFPERREAGRDSYQVLLYEFKADLNTYLDNLGPEAPVRTLEEIIAFNESRASETMPYFGQDILISSQEKGPLTEKEYVDALANCRRILRDEGIDKIMDEKNLDAIIAPTGGPAWLTDLVTGDHFLGGSSSPAAIAGYPNITVPMGYISGLPVGLSFFGRAWSESTLIEIAFSFEQGTLVRQEPRFRPSVAL